MMEKYTCLEQAVKDPSLVIITDSIATQKELNKAFLKFKVLPRKQKRFSNYYSNLFLGRSVPDMYVYMKDNLEEGNGIFADWERPSEKYMVSEPDLYYKEESFNSGDTNICFILGHSGSGKSMMARMLEGEDIDHIELDDLLLTKDHFAKEELREYSDMFAAFFDGEGAKYYIGVDERDSIPKEEYEDKVFIDFVKFAMDYAAQHREKQYIVEGIWIYLYFDYAAQHREKQYIVEGIWIYLYFDDPSVFEDYAVFIKGTSFLKSKIRTMKREMKRDKETLQDRKQMFGREVRNYLLDEDKIDSYREYFSDHPDTVFREETNESTKQSEFVINELNSIDKCFVYDDADGIKDIMKIAVDNTELSNWNKMRIINECNLALVDLRIDHVNQ